MACGAVFAQVRPAGDRAAPTNTKGPVAGAPSWEWSNAVQPVEGPAGVVGQPGEPALPLGSEALLVTAPGSAGPA